MCEKIVAREIIANLTATTADVKQPQSQTDAIPLFVSRQTAGVRKEQLLRDSTFKITPLRGLGQGAACIADLPGASTASAAHGAHKSLSPPAVNTSYLA
ncbi:hypothetical protein H2199_006387 [Coniosporium tulheliwenetii]|uniref:Uncharacterized protein n=1 Tax=Coniosporium tulheliwenetii TaxID=3383036 RepID=A0ACC2YVZ2_9PEZI|nr:hypothetical protein H2199_006387 [Cladosporium sp. JES 115]